MRNGSVEGQLLNVAYTERSGRYRLISARRPTKKETDGYFTQINGTALGLPTVLSSFCHENPALSLLS